MSVSQMTRKVGHIFKKKWKQKTSCSSNFPHGSHFWLKPIFVVSASENKVKEKASVPRVIIVAVVLGIILVVIVKVVVVVVVVELVDHLGLSS